MKKTTFTSIVVLVILCLALSGCGNGSSDKLQKATMLINNGMDNEAATLITEVVSNEPNNPDAYVVLAAQCLKKGDINGAVTKFDKAVELNPDLKAELLPFAAKFGRHKDCELRGIKYMQEKFAGGPDPTPLFSWFYDKDKTAVFADEATAKTAVDMKLVTTDEFAAHFPKSSLTPILLDQQAAGLAQDNPLEAKRLFERIIKEYPNSEVAKSAKFQLGELSTTTNISLAFKNNLWTGKAYKAGDRIRINITNPPRTWNMGLLGDKVINGFNLQFFFGSRDEWYRIITDVAYQPYGNYDQYTKNGNRQQWLRSQCMTVGNGVDIKVPRDGTLCFRPTGVPESEAEKFDIVIKDTVK